MSTIPISPLSLNQLTRDTWGSYDAAAIAQLAGLAEDQCYSLKLYKAPADNQELIPGVGAGQQGYVAYGLRITPGSIIVGYQLAAVPNVENDPAASVPAAFTVQITDQSLQHKFFDDPVSSLFLSNYNPTCESNVAVQAGTSENFLAAPHPVTGNGLFLVEIQNTSTEQQRIELIFVVLEACLGA